MSPAETAEVWATVAVAIATTVAIVIGGGWALWRFVLLAPFTPNLEPEVRDCIVRKLSPTNYIYTVDVVVENRSNIVFFVDRVFIRISNTPPPYHVEPLQLIAEAIIPPGIEVNDTLPPRARRTLRGHSGEVAWLHHMVWVEWILQVKKPRWFGLLGRQSGLIRGGRRVPVDASSLSLYMDLKDANHD